MRTFSPSRRPARRPQRAPRRCPQHRQCQSEPRTGRRSQAGAPRLVQIRSPHSDSVLAEADRSTDREQLRRVAAAPSGPHGGTTTSASAISRGCRRVLGGRSTSVASVCSAAHCAAPHRWDKACYSPVFTGASSASLIVCWFSSQLAWVSRSPMSAGQPPKSRAERRSGAVRECPQLPAHARGLGGHGDEGLHTADLARVSQLDCDAHSSAGRAGFLGSVIGGARTSNL